MSSDELQPSILGTKEQFVILPQYDFEITVDRFSKLGLSLRP